MLENSKAIQSLACRRKQKGKTRTELGEDWRHDHRSIHVWKTSTTYVVDPSGGFRANSSNTYIHSYTGRRGSINKDCACLNTWPWRESTSAILESIDSCSPRASKGHRSARKPDFFITQKALLSTMSVGFEGPENPGHTIFWPCSPGTTTQARRQSIFVKIQNVDEI
jgi:hypothetical protein